MTMQFFRQDNTEGYTDAELAQLNETVEVQLRMLGVEPGDTDYEEEAKRACERASNEFPNGLSWGDRGGPNQEIVTYIVPGYGDYNEVSLTAAQEAAFKRAGIWPRDDRGEEFSEVSHPAHKGMPTWSDQEIAELWPETRHFLPYSGAR